MEWSTLVDLVSLYVRLNVDPELGKKFLDITRFYLAIAQTLGLQRNVENVSSQ